METLTVSRKCLTCLRKLCLDQRFCIKVKSQALLSPSQTSFWGLTLIALLRVRGSACRFLNRNERTLTHSRVGLFL